LTSRVACPARTLAERPSHSLLPLSPRAHSHTACRLPLILLPHPPFLLLLLLLLLFLPQVHPTQPFILSSSDDMQIKLWDWERNFENTQIFEGHVHYVMMVKFNPRDPNYFASASLDKSIKVWGIGTPMPHFALEGENGHKQGVNCIAYLSGSDRPHIISGSDDLTVKIWDYQTKACLQTLEGHTANVSAVCAHPRLPVLISGGEDGSVRVWHSTTYRCETKLDYHMERIWALSTVPDRHYIAMGCDEGTIVIKMGNDIPVISMDSNGKVVWASNNEMRIGSVKGIVAESGIADGDTLPIAPRDLGTAELYPQQLCHNANGRFVAACGDGEYIIYTATRLRNMGYGAGLEFVWSTVATGDYAVRTSNSSITVSRNFPKGKAQNTFAPDCPADRIFGGAALIVACPTCICAYDWASCKLIRQIDVAPNEVYWAESGDLCALSCDESYFILSFNRELVADTLAERPANAPVGEGIDESFTPLHEIPDKVETGIWVGDCFL